MEAPQPVNEVPAKRNQTPLIIAVVAIVLCCFCLVLASCGLLWFYHAFERRNTSIPYRGFPSCRDTGGHDPCSSFRFSGCTPVLRWHRRSSSRRIGQRYPASQDTWQYVAAAAVGQGCDQPIGADSTIEVLQQPDANGVWLEKWTVACSSGDSYAFEVEYILDATGATFNVKSCLDSATIDAFVSNS